MSIEILKILEKREAFDKYKKFIKDHLITSEIKTIITDISTYYTKHEKKTTIDWDSFLSWFKLKHNNYTEEKINIYTKLIERVKQVKVDDSLVLEIIHTFILKDYGSKIGEEGYKIEEGDTDNLDIIYDLVQDYITETDFLQDHEKYLVKEDVLELVNNITKTGYSWRYECLNRALGPLRKGDFVVFATRPDGGKTSMLAGQATHIASQLKADEYVMWFNNESEGSKVKWRCIQVSTGRTTDEIKFDPITTRDQYTRNMGGNKDKILIFDKAILTTSFIEDMLRRYKCGLIIVDQLYKVHGFDKENSDVFRQAKLFQWAREIAKQYAPLLTVHQLDVNAEGQQWVGYEKLYGSKTAIQGEADAIVTMGWIKDPSCQDKRYLYVPKNKLTGGNTSIPGERNGKYELTIIPETGRFNE